MVIVTSRELKRAVREHYRPNASTCSDYLLMFYVVECAIKNALLSISRKQYLDGELLSYFNLKDGHDLTALYKILSDKLMLPRHVIGSRPTVQIKHSRKGQSQVKVSEFHQAWRYGVELDASTEGDAVNWMKQIIDVMKQNQLVNL